MAAFMRPSVRLLLSVCQVRKQDKTTAFKRMLSSLSSFNISDLKERGLIENIFPWDRTKELESLLSSPQGIYCGFDPTAESLHVGNLVSLIGLIHAQRAGHSPVAVIGGATALIGDPSGKAEERTPMKAEDVEKNIVGLTENVERIFNNHSNLIHKGPLPEYKILNNRDWYKEIDVITFFSTIGRHFRVGEMISRHSVQSRLNSKVGISCTEFMYQVFQATDWLHLFEKHKCSFQIGGNDQTGNITSGFELIHKLTNKYVFGLLVPLLLTPSGVKLGKSSGNSVWLDSNKSSPFDLYQYFFNMPDSAVEQYLKLFSFMSLSDIQAVVAQHNKSPEKRYGQKQLAEEITLLVHGDSGLKSALRSTEVLFGDAVVHLKNMGLSDLQQLFKDAKTSELSLKPDMTVFNLCQELKCFNRDVDADRIIKAGGVYINQQRIADPQFTLKGGDCVLNNGITLVRIGKKNYYIVKWKL